MIDEKRIADFFAELVSIDSPSLEECEMADTLKAKFAEIGVNFTEDHTQEQTGSNAGNLFARIPGSIDGAPVLFAAHMDTVEPAKGKKAVFHDDGTVTSDGTTVLGADDLAGVTAIYEAVRHITEAGAPHSPIEILISTGEELYCKGANAFDYSQVQAKEAYVLDLSGAIGAAAYAAPTLVSFKAEIQGKAAHAGFHPEDGINSIQAAARAVAQLPQGHVAESTTANIGKIGGGSGTTTYGENIGVMAATKVYSTAAYWCAAGFALLLSLCPKFGAIINTIPAGVLGGVTTLLYGMIGMVGIRIWVENKVNFDKPLNIMVAAITMIIAIGQFAFAFNGISFNGIAIGTIVILVSYHGLKAIGKATGTIDKNDPDIL